MKGFSCAGFWPALTCQKPRRKKRQTGAFLSTSETRLPAAVTDDPAVRTAASSCTEVFFGMLQISLSPFSHFGRALAR